MRSKRHRIKRAIQRIHLGATTDAGDWHGRTEKRIRRRIKNEFPEFDEDDIEWHLAYDFFAEQAGERFTRLRIG